MELTKNNRFNFFHFEKMRNFQNGGYGISILSKKSLHKTYINISFDSNTTAEQCAVQKEGDYCQGLTLIEIPIKYQNITDLSIYFGTTRLDIGLQQLNEAIQIVLWMNPRC
jgi:hypothetical protein